MKPAGHAAELLPGRPHNAHASEAPAFGEPWQAKGFALVLALHERGLFSWSEWAQALAEQIAAAKAGGGNGGGGQAGGEKAGGDAGSAEDTYYRQWVAALESLLAQKGATSATELERYRLAWDRAADRTPHGSGIELTAADFNPVSPI